MALVAAVVLLTAACGAAGAADPTARPGTNAREPQDSSGGVLTRTNDAAQVTVQVTPSAAPAPGAALTFKVALDTHSVDLDGYDLARLASLRVDGGTEFAPMLWSASKGGHHREGTLAFPARIGDAPTIPADARSVSLVIRDIAGVAERSFTWTL